METTFQCQAFFRPPALCLRKEGILYGSLFDQTNRQNGKYSNIQVPLPPTVPPTVPPTSYLLPLNPRGPTYVPTLVSQSFKQGQGMEACTVRMLWKNRGGDIHRYIGR